MSSWATCPEPGGSACCYWNGYGTQCNHPAQGLHLELAVSCGLVEGSHTAEVDQVRARPEQPGALRQVVEPGGSACCDWSGY